MYGPGPGSNLVHVSEYKELSSLSLSSFISISVPLMSIPLEYEAYFNILLGYLIFSKQNLGK